MKRLMLPIFGLFLFGCAAPSTSTVTGPSGENLFTSKCNRSAEGCFSEAANQCKGPYQVVDSHSKAGRTAADLLPGPVTWYYMTYQCGRSDGRMPQFPFRGQQYTPAPVVVQPYTAPRMTTTNCSRFGQSVNCTTF
ncbi:hypothetical protein PE067_16235 [Paracoccus sp. DMF-8]|uniref:hypothetical protein n=1 Tax=Paracoccus sp. DMF-8 TaxID=3019445 RepID=UPI0023E3DE91|nr:hypothetical protein [Paracoccus sp. DMF-8]MDF3607557.1 hypothetical protein [Paracoccus sp. DMF-8]